MHQASHLARMACVIAAALLITTTTRAALISNGSFETGTGTDGGLGTYFSLPANSTTDLPGWTVGPSGFFWYYHISPGYPLNDGTRFLNFATGPESVKQDFAGGVYASQTYQVSFWERARDAGPGGTFAANNSTITSTVILGTGTATSGTLTLTTSAVGTSTWTNYTFTFIPSTDTTATLQFSGTAPAGNGTLFDNVVVTELPEPATIGLLLIAPVAFTASRRRR